MARRSGVEAADGWEVRPAAVADVEAIAAITVESPAAPQWDGAEYGRLLTPAAGSTVERVVLVAVANGAIAGFAVYSLLRAVLPPEAELESLAVAADCRRNGVAAALLRAVRKAAARAGADTLLLEVRAGNTPALRLYAGAGFERAGLRPGYYSNPREDAVLMQLAFSSDEVHT